MPADIERLNIERPSCSGRRQAVPATGAVGGVRRCLDRVRVHVVDVNAVIAVADETALPGGVPCDPGSKR